MVLPPLTVLHTTYSVQQPLGEAGPFDVRYLGQDLETKDKVVIREFLPTFLVSRAEGETSIKAPSDDKPAELYQSGVAYFKRESEVLAELDHPVVPSGYQVFEANGTVYRVRSYMPGMSLAKGLSSKGKLSEKVTLTIMVPVLEALAAAHEKGLYHGGVSPHTIRLLEDGHVMLTSFRGATIQFARQAGRLGDLVQPGTSAIEQYTPRGSQGPWTDVYAAAATIVHAITGNEVPAAPKRLDDRDPVKDLLQDAGAFSSPAMRDALSHALTVDPSKRLQTVEALRNALVDASEKYDASTASYIITPVAPQKGAEEEEEVVEEFASDRTSRAPARPTRAPEPERSNTALLVGLPILLVAGLVGGYFAFSGGGGSTGASGGAIGTYEDFRMQADSLYYLRNLAEAKALYNQALGERPEDQYVTQRLRQIEEMQAQSSEMRFQNRMARGDSLLTAGNALLEKGNVTEAARVLGQASAAFEMAAEVKPDNETVDERLSVVEESFTRLAEARGSEGGNTDDLYALFREQGNEQMAAGNYRAARRKFEEALDFKPGDDYARQQLQRVQNQLARQESLRRFENLLTQALDLLDEEKPEEAQPLLAQAAEIYPDNKRLGEAMARAEQMASQSDEREQQYMAQRTAGDQAFSEERFADAARAYKKALDYRPGDEYAAQRLEEAQQEAEMMQLATTERRRQVERREKMKEEEKSDIYAVVDVQPQLVGGLAALHREVEYPRMAQKAGIEGRVYVQVTVNADGTVREAVVTKGIGGGCDEEAKRVLENATFEPAQVDGRPVAARTTQWIQFRLQN